MKQISPLLLLLFSSVLVMGVVHHLALEFFLYWEFPWLDIPMHFLGGVIISFVLLLLPLYFHAISRRYVALFPILAGVLIVGLLWEIFEIWAGVPLIEPGFEKDMVKDLIVDILGGSVGYIVGSRINALDHVEN